MNNQKEAKRTIVEVRFSKYGNFNTGTQGSTYPFVVRKMIEYVDGTIKIVDADYFQDIKSAIDYAIESCEYCSAWLQICPMQFTRDEWTAITDRQMTFDVEPSSNDENDQLQSGLSLSVKMDG